MTKINRIIERYEQVEVPEGMKACPICKGKGKMSAYDRGVRSIAHSSKLAALEVCMYCGGKGMIPDEEYIF